MGVPTSTIKKVPVPECCTTGGTDSTQSYAQTRQQAAGKPDIDSILLQSLTQDRWQVGWFPGGIDVDAKEYKYRVCPLLPVPLSRRISQILLKKFI